MVPPKVPRGINFCPSATTNSQSVVVEVFDFKKSDLAFITFSFAHFLFAIFGMFKHRASIEVRKDVVPTFSAKRITNSQWLAAQTGYSADEEVRGLKTVAAILEVPVRPRPAEGVDRVEGWNIQPQCRERAIQQDFVPGVEQRRGQCARFPD
jgi:hypothetical protein